MKRYYISTIFLIAGLISLSFVLPTAHTTNTLDRWVGKWKLKRSAPETGKNKCYVDTLELLDDGTFSITFHTLIEEVLARYTFVGNAKQLSGNQRIQLGDGLAYLNNLSVDSQQLQFQFEYGENLGMFCTRKHQPFDHPHLPHELIGNKLP